MTVTLTRLRVKALRNMESARTEMQPWRCVACGEAVDRNPGAKKRDCACTRGLGGIQ